MIYIGWFSFNVKNDGGDESWFRQGEFNLVVEATDPDDAYTKFKNRLLSDDYWDDSDLLEDVTEVYIDGITEFTKIPEKPVLINFTQSDSNEKGVVSIKCIAPCDIDQEKLESYGDINEGEGEDDSELKTRTPFVIINSPID